LPGAVGVGVAGRSSYRGYGLQQVDEKGRVAIPAPLRAALLARSPTGDDGKAVTFVVLQAHERHPCIRGYDLDFAAEREVELEALARQNALADGSPDDDVLRGGMVSDEQPFDTSGRFVMPSFPRKHAHIGKWAFFHGVGRYFEIWDPATLIATPGIHPNVRALVEHELAERKVVL
jgi:MraZ protein